MEEKFLLWFQRGGAFGENDDPWGGCLFGSRLQGIQAQNYHIQSLHMERKTMYDTMLIECCYTILAKHEKHVNSIRMEIY